MRRDPPLEDAQFNALKAALAKAGLPADAIGERRQLGEIAWLVYLGRFADSQTWQQKADELARLDVKFERVNTPGRSRTGPVDRAIHDGGRRRAQARRVDPSRRARRAGGRADGAGPCSATCRCGPPIRPGTTPPGRSDSTRARRQRLNT